MTETPSAAEGPSAAAVAAAVTACPAVAGLHAGPVGSYLPGGRVPGVRLTGERATVVVAMAYPATVADLEEQVRAALAPLISVPLDIEVADIVLPEERVTPPAALPAPPAGRIAPALNLAPPSPAVPSMFGDPS